MVNKQDFFSTYSYFDKGILVEIIDIFTNEAPVKVDLLYQDLEANAFDSLRFNAHSLKGTIGSFSAPKAWEMAKDLEFTASSLKEDKGVGYSPESVRKKIDILADAVRTMINELTDIKSEILSSLNP